MANRTLREVPAPRRAVRPPPRSLRLPQCLGLKVDPGRVLDALDVTVIGAGAVGRLLALILARLLIGTLRIVDHGVYKSESLLTQAISPADVGRPKASNTGWHCKRLSPQTRVLVFDGRVQELDLSDLIDTHLVLLATDNLPAEVEAAQRCLHLSRRLFQASVDGSTLVAQVRFFGNHGAAGACPACGYGKDEWAHLNQETIFSCEGLAANGLSGVTSAMPTMSTCFLCSLAADLAMTQVFRLVLGLGPEPADQVLEYCGYTNRLVATPLSRNPNCPCDHSTWDVRRAPRPLRDCSLGELLGAAGLDDDTGLAKTAVAVGGMAFVERAACRGCGTASVQRFAPEEATEVRCPTCNRPAPAQPFYTHPTVPFELLRPLAGRPLRQLGAAAPRSVLVRGADRAVLFTDGAVQKGTALCS